MCVFGVGWMSGGRPQGSLRSEDRGWPSRGEGEGEQWAEQELGAATVWPLLPLGEARCSQHGESDTERTNEGASVREGEGETEGARQTGGQARAAGGGNADSEGWSDGYSCELRRAAAGQDTSAAGGAEGEGADGNAETPSGSAACSSPSLAMDAAADAALFLDDVDEMLGETSHLVACLDASDLPAHAPTAEPSPSALPPALARVTAHQGEPLTAYGTTGPTGQECGPSDIEPLLWVQCSACHKWRTVPEEVHSDVWYCERNHEYDPERANCAAPEDPRAHAQEVETLYFVERILGVKVDGAGVERFRVRWRGYAAHEDTWELADGLPAVALNAFWKGRHAPLAGRVGQANEGHAVRGRTALPSLKRKADTDVSAGPRRGDHFTGGTCEAAEVDEMLGPGAFEAGWQAQLTVRGCRRHWAIYSPVHRKTFHTKAAARDAFLRGSGGPGPSKSMASTAKKRKQMASSRAEQHATAGTVKHRHGKQAANARHESSPADVDDILGAGAHAAGWRVSLAIGKEGRRDWLVHSPIHSKPFHSKAAGRQAYRDASGEPAAETWTAGATCTVTLPTGDGRLSVGDTARGAATPADDECITADLNDEFDPWSWLPNEPGEWLATGERRIAAP